MSDASSTPPAAAESKSGAKTVVENQSFQDVLRALVGKVVTMVNPESYESAPMGYQIRAGFYRAKVVGLGLDYLIVLTEFPQKGETSAEPVKQYVPLSKIKRLSLMKTERIIHL